MPEVMKTIFMLNLAVHEFFLPISCWHFNIYEQENSIIGLAEPIKTEYLDILYLLAFYNFMLSCVEQENIFTTSSLLLECVF